MKDRLQRPPNLRAAGSTEAFLTSDDDLHRGLPSPPYRTVASTSNIALDTLGYGESSPAYDETGHRTMPTDEKHGVPLSDAEVPRPDENDAKTKPSVHYQADVHRPAPSYHVREDSADVLSSHGTDTDDDEIDDYDWSGEEDLVDEEAKYEERMGVKAKRTGWGFKRIITLLFSSLIGSTLLAGILVTPGIVLHFYWYNPHPTEHRLYVEQNIQAWTFWAAANLLISWYLAMIVDIIPIVAHFAIAGAWGHVSEFVKTRFEMYNSVKHTIKPLLYAACAWASWVIVFDTIYNLYDSGDSENSRAPYTHRVSQVISFLFFLALVICAQRMLSHAIAFAFHRTAYKERVDSVSETLRVLEKLRDYRPKSRTPKRGSRTPVFGNLGFSTPFSEKEHFNFLSSALKVATPGRKAHHADSRDDADDADTEDAGAGGRKKNTLNGKGKEKRKSVVGMVVAREDSAGVSTPSEGMSRPATPSPLNPNAGESPHRYPPSHPGRQSEESAGEDALTAAAKAIKNAVLHDARNLKGKEAQMGTMAWDVTSAHEAKRLARSIYMRFRDRHRKYLLPSDFYPAFATKEDAEAGFRVFDKDNNGDISRAEIKTTILKVYKERRFLARSMRDVSVALRTLDHILLFFALVILFFISLSVFGVQVGDSLTSVYTLGIGASFIFKNAASNAFDAIMFLFVTHPYDTGDRCFIDDENLVVKKMGLFATVFTRSDGTETYYFNSQLFSKFITNVRRSGKMFENLTMQVAWRTPLEKLDALEKCLNDWLATEENRWYEPSTSLTLQHIDYQNFLEITIGIGHNGTWQDWGLRNARKTAFHAAVQFYCRQLGITSYKPPRPIVYADADTHHFTLPPPSPGAYGDDEYVPGSPSPSERPTEFLAREVKPALGFLPPAGARTALTRARKSKSRKAMMRGMGADG